MISIAWANVMTQLCHNDQNDTHEHTKSPINILILYTIIILMAFSEYQQVNEIPKIYLISVLELRILYYCVPLLSLVQFLILSIQLSI